MDSQIIRQRRRRVALDKLQPEGTEAVADEGSSARGDSGNSGRQRKSPTRPYTPGARRTRQFRTTDLIPKRIWSVTAIIALLLAALAALNLLHLNSPNWSEVIGHEGVAVLSLDSGRGIGIWYSNFLLLMTSCVSLQLFLLRRHRRDDYRGSYRVWIWLAAIFMMASAASVTGISQLLSNVFANTIGSGGAGGSVTLLLIVKMTGLALLLIRGLVEVRFSRLAVFGLLIVLLAYGTAALINEIPEVHARASGFIHASHGNCLLLGSTALFISALGFARFVYLDANGLISGRKKEVRAKKNQKKKAKAKKISEAKTSEAKVSESKTKAKKASLTEATSGDDSAVAEPERRKSRWVRKSRKVAEDDSAEVTTESSSAATKKRKVKKRQQAADTSGSIDIENTRKAVKSKSVNSKPKSTSSSSRPDQEVKSSSGQNSLQKALKKRTQAKLSETDEQLLAADDETLSKSERRRMRKLQRRGERRAA